MEQQDFDRACRFINALVGFVQRYGVSSSAMESQLVRVAHALHLQGQFTATPAQVQSILWYDDEEGQRQHISVARAGNYDLNKLAQIKELLGRVESGDTNPADGLQRIRAIDSTGQEYSQGLEAAGFVLSGLGFGVLLGISWLNILLGGALSLLSFGITRLPLHSQALKNSLELIIATVVAAIATLLAIVLPGSTPMAVTVCACIFFVPGFGLTLGTSELMNGNMLSGLIGFSSAAITSLKLVVGALIGTAIVRDFASVPLPKLESGVPHVWAWVAAPLLVLGLAILFRTRRKDLVWPILGGVVVWMGLELGSLMGAWQGTFIGAILLMVVSRLFARLSRLPAEIILLPASMLLVPGVAALRAIYDAQSMGLVAGLKSTVGVFVLIVAILGGLQCGEAIWNINQRAISTVTGKLFRKKQ